MLQSTDVFYPDNEVSISDLTKVSQEISSVTFDENLASLLIDLRVKLAKKTTQADGIVCMPVTDRMFRFAVRILKAEAWWNGHKSIQEDDFEILQHVLWSDPKDKSQIYSSILEVINPEKDKIMQLYYDSVDLHDKLKGDSSKSKSKPDKRKEIEKQAFEAAQKIRNAKKQISESIKELESKGRKVDDLKLICKKVDDLLSDVYENTLGTTGFKGWAE